VPKNGSLFFTIFQTFMTEAPRHSRAGRKPPRTGTSMDFRLRGNDGWLNELVCNFGDYPSDFFDIIIIIDECRRGGANDEST